VILVKFRKCWCSLRSVWSCNQTLLAVNVYCKSGLECPHSYCRCWCFIDLSTGLPESILQLLVLHWPHYRVAREHIAAVGASLTSVQNSQTAASICRYHLSPVKRTCSGYADEANSLRSFAVFKHCLQCISVYIIYQPFFYTCLYFIYLDSNLYSLFWNAVHLPYIQTVYVIMFVRNAIITTDKMCVCVCRCVCFCLFPCWKAFTLAGTSLFLLRAICSCHG
jgi:hypothetical protein